MSAASSAAASGAVLGVVFVFLLQQFGFVALSSTFLSILYLALAAIVGGAVFGAIARLLARRRANAAGPGPSP